MKQCSKCNLMLNLDAFYSSKRHKDCLLSHCKQCESLRSKLKNQNNKDTRLAKSKKYREQNKEKCSQISKDWRNRNKQRVASVLRNWAENNKDKVNAKWMKRKTSKIKRTPPWLTADHFKKIEHIYFLAKNASKVSGEPYEVDHIIPLQGKTVSGLHVPWNLQVLPKYLNRKKSNTLFGE